SMIKVYYPHPSFSVEVLEELPYPFWGHLPLMSVVLAVILQFPLVIKWMVNNYQKRILRQK
ncbi:MAG: hypothetical protein QW231_02400, partial [Candidatus Bathyarchaeia archaeon]